VTHTRPQRSEVQVHYREIASEYGQRANQTCEWRYHRLVENYMKGQTRVTELGSGSSGLLDSLGIPITIACDLSREMLLMRTGGNRTHRVVAVGERLPFGDARFDGVFLINVLEHVVNLEMVLSESARVLEEGGLWLAVTPNGNWETLLDLAERWNLKIPEGPHQFLTTSCLREAVRRHFEVVEHRTILVLPAGPPRLSSLFDLITVASLWGWGFFQYIVARKRPTLPVPKNQSRSTGSEVFRR
jgi:ubiquinone/menaquinone biosynthesis C-methylase UbiE